ncbi:MAG: hypothetical protein NTY04_00295 [Candidatus Staskawiczbacteria bacterium]|nr:hypothetical protein [Candidatus Staskawiczbacteria bacterium]
MRKSKKSRPLGEKFISRISDEKLLEEVERHIKNNLVVSLIKEEIRRRIMLHKTVSERLVASLSDELVALVKKMRGADADLLSQSRRSKAFARSFAHIKCRLESLMGGSECECCKTAASAGK